MPDQALAQAVGTLLRQSLRDGIAEAQHDIQSKQSEVAGDLVTDTDVAVQERLQDGLRVLLPEATFLGEEGYEGSSTIGADPHWIVDPLDGTLNYACDLPFFGASIALVNSGQPVLGVIYDYGADCLFSAVKGQGALCNDVALQWDAEAAARAPVGISSGFLARMTDPATRETYTTDWLGSRFRIFGSQAVQLCWAAAGRLRLNINCEAKLWDDAAGTLICHESGAGYAALSAHPLYPLDAASPAVRGKSLFSVAGSPDLVQRCLTEFG